MNAKQILVLAASMLASCVGASVAGDETERRTVRVAELEIDPAQLESYKAALKEEIETSVRVEPGVLLLYAVSEKTDPAHIIILEMYSSLEAYSAHIETPHFRKYKEATRDMVKSLRLTDTVPVVLGAKAKWGGRHSSGAL
jgi:quinol monooxygenase YgiN